MEAFSANGGGVSMTFKDKPPPFTVWTYRDKHGVASTGVGAHPISDDPAAELTVFQFDPDTMDFNTVPGAKTSVREIMECRVEQLEFDALPLFQGALQGAVQIVELSAFLLNQQTLLSCYL